MGTLPPEGRDLDLLARTDDAESIAESLGRRGFAARGSHWVAFTGCSAQVVELVPPESLGLPADALDELFHEAAPLRELTNVVEPSPHHTLLIVARKVAGDRWRIAPKHRARIVRALAADATAWERARGRAAAWGAERDLGRLEALYRGGDSRSIDRWRRLVRRPRRARIIAVAAPTRDIACAHADALREALARLGLNPLVASRRASAGPRGRQQRGPALLSAVPAAVSLWFPVVRDAGRGRVLIYERSALDLTAEAAARGARPTVVRWHARIVGLLAPTPLRSYFLDPPVLADDSDDVDRHGYGAAAAISGVRRIDRAETEVLCAEIARDAWDALSRGRHGRSRWPAGKRNRPRRDDSAATHR
jgi:hypothetical protein